MFNPLSLRLCCMAMMAPALTSEAATRTRDSLPGAPTPPSVEASLINGRDSQNSIGSIKGRDHHLLQGAAHHQKSNQVLSLSQGLQRRLVESGHIILAEKPPEGQNPKPDPNLPIKLESISRLSDLYRQQQLEVFGNSILSPQPSNPLVYSKNKMSASGQRPTNTSIMPPTNTNTETMKTTISTQSRLAFSGSTSTVSSKNNGTPSSSNNPLDSNRLQMMSAPLQFRAEKIISTVNSSLPSHQTPTVSHSKTPLSNGLHLLQKTSCPAGPHAAPSGKINSDVKPSNVTSTVVKETQVLDDSSVFKSDYSRVHATDLSIDSVARRQRNIQTKASRLLRQLRRLQCRQALSHTKQQLSGFVDFQQRAFQASGKVRTVSMDVKTELLQNRDVKNMSTAALVNFIQKMQSSQASLRQQLAAQSQDPEPPTKLDEETCSELERVSGHLTCNLSHLKCAMDSDATESSSGGESCDEPDYDDDWDGKAQRPPLQCRAEWRWASDRAAVAARWTWLQAQVSDLEYRIRQQYDIYKQIRANKGTVVLGDHVIPDDTLTKRPERASKKLSPLEEKIASLQAKNEMSPANISMLLSNVDKQSSRLNQQLPPLYTPHQSPCSQSSSSGAPTPQRTPGNLNGFVDGMCTPEDQTNRTYGFDTVSPPADHTCQAARCRPVRTYRKRKLLRTKGVHHLNRKAARLSTVQCHCYPPISSCAMCGDRYNNTVKLEAETMPYMEKVALLDVSFHPVLSFPQDVSLTAHFEGMLKTGEWQQKPPHRTYKLPPTEHRYRLKESSRKYKPRIRKTTSATLLSSAKIRNKYEQTKQLSRNQAGALIGSPIKQVAGGECVKLSRAEMRLRKRKDQLHQLDALQRKNNHGTSKDNILSGSHQSQTLRELKEAALRKKRGECAYDINNIVIPYNIAATTRVEKLQYKEILTPKWRMVAEGKSLEEPSPAEKDIEIPPVPVPEPSTESNHEDEEIEDLDDDVYSCRHLVCEIQEKKRFSTVLPLSQRRSRGAQRVDSVASNSMEPASPEVSQAVETVLVTPPPTPAVINTITPMQVDEQEESLKHSSSTSSLDNIRRRSSSVSSSKSLRSRSASHSEERPRDDDSYPVVPPWPKRSFPLGEDDNKLLDSDPHMSRVSKRTGVSSRVITEEMIVTPDSVPPSPIPSNSDNSEIPEDPDDPEWTVVSERPQVIKQPNIVLKLAKR